jgi:hypothetical protein
MYPNHRTKKIGFIGISEAEDLRVVISEDGKWTVAMRDSNGNLTNESCGVWTDRENEKVLCENLKGSYAFLIKIESDGISVDGGKHLKKDSISISCEVLNCNFNKARKRLCLILRRYFYQSLHQKCIASIVSSIRIRNYRLTWKLLL